LGFDKTQLQSPLFGVLGNTGTASPLLLLVQALEGVKSGDNILLASYGNGSDALLLRVNEGIEKLGDRSRLQILLNSKRMVPDYLTYLKWRGLLTQKDPRVVYTVTYASAPAIYREKDRILSLYGSQCTACGAVQYPPQRICIKCHAKDTFESIPLFDKKAKIFTSAKDPITGVLVGLVNFEGGGRIYCSLTDGDLSEFGIDAAVEMSFRKLELLPSDTTASYFWKAVPLRNGI